MKCIFSLYLFLSLYTYKASKLDFLPHIDGKIEEFENFEKIADFVEIQPEEGKIPPVKTECYIAYDENNIYFAFKCYDDMETVRKTLTERDRFAMDDMVFIYLDTYGEEKEGYGFATNPLGIQYDGIKGPPPNNMDDWSFDTYFEVKAYISDSFWSCEFKIPFSSLRFENKEKQEWKLVLGRMRPRGSLEFYIFPLISKNNPSFFGQGATLLIPERISPREKKLSLLPYLIAFQNGLREEKYKYEKSDYNLGLTGKYNFSRNIFLDFATNPDFAQIETDEPQVDVNSPYAIYYLEKRPLFLEGLSLFELPINIFYTRMVVKPLYAVKLNGRIKKYEFSFFSSYDEKTSYIIPFEDFSTNIFTDKKSFLNLLRLKMDFINKESYIGFLVSSREVKKDSFDNGFNRVFNFDTKIRFLKNYTISYQGIYSITKESRDTNLLNYGNAKFYKDYTYTFDGEKIYGFANRFYFGGVFRNFVFNAEYKDFSPLFRSDMGYITKNNLKSLYLSAEPRFYPNKYGFSEIYFSYGYWRIYNYDNILKDNWFSFSHGAKLTIFQMGYSMSYSHTLKQNVFGKIFENLRDLNFYLYLTPFKCFLLNGNIKVGKTIYYGELIPAYNQVYSTNASFLSGKFLSDFSYTKYFLYKEPWKNTIYKIDIFDLRLNYQITKFLYFRFIASYYSHSKNLLIYPLISYELNPFTLFYLGANINTIRYPYKIEAQDHQIFLKFQYWFKI